MTGVQTCALPIYDIFEEVIGGINHSEIGYKMAQKWNFPTLFADVMRYHHHPGQAPEEYRDITCIVSLADALDNIEQGYLSPDMIDPYPLHFFEFPSAEEFLEAFSTLEKSFETENLMP